jgi:hypothetical protein
MTWTHRDRIRLLRDGVLLVVGLGIVVGEYLWDRL